jgi:hypothetical protein
MAKRSRKMSRSHKRSRKLSAKRVLSNARKIALSADRVVVKSKPLTKAIAKGLRKHGASKQLSRKLASHVVKKFRKSLKSDPKYKRFISTNLASAYLKHKKSR